MMNKNPEVNAFLEKKKHPMTTEINQVREIILTTDQKITEAIKWSSSTLMYKGNIASYFLNAKNFVRLMFHKGALINREYASDFPLRGRITANTGTSSIFDAHHDDDHVCDLKNRWSTHLYCSSASHDKNLIHIPGLMIPVTF